MESCDEGRGGGVPESVGLFGHIESGANAYLDRLGIGRHYAEHGAIVRKDTGVWSPGDVERRRLAVGRGLSPADACSQQC